MALPYTLYRNSLGLIKKQISFRLFLKRLKMLGRIHRIPELIEFHKFNGLRACFYFGMDNALRLSYNYQKTQPLIESLIRHGHEVGVHGIEVRSKVGILNEHKRFKEISGLCDFGIRTHYLRLSGYTHEIFAEVGYVYDSSIQGCFNPCKISGIWEFPIGIMDASLVPESLLNQDLDMWKSNTLEKIEKAQKAGLDVFVINFHDTYFNEEQYPVIYRWFTWLIDNLISKKFEFVTFNEYMGR